MYNAAEEGDLERVTLLVEQGAEKDKTFGNANQTALIGAARNCHLNVVRYFVEQGADMERACSVGCTPLIYASSRGHFELARYLLEQGANRDKATVHGMTSLHYAAAAGYLEIAKLLMVYGADLNARDSRGQLPIDMEGISVEVKQAICDEPRRRMSEAPGKRATELDQHLNAAQENVEEEDEFFGEKAVVADEDQDSEPSSDEEDD